MTRNAIRLSILRLNRLLSPGLSYAAEFRANGNVELSANGFIIRELRARNMLRLLRARLLEWVN